MSEQLLLFDFNSEPEEKRVQAVETPSPEVEASNTAAPMSHVPGLQKGNIVTMIQGLVKPYVMPTNSKWQVQREPVFSEEGKLVSKVQLQSVDTGEFLEANPFTLKNLWLYGSVRFETVIK